MSTQRSGKVQFNCGFDHSQMESCHGKHTMEVVLHHTSDTASIIMDDELDSRQSLIMSDAGYCALETAMERLRMK